MTSRDVLFCAVGLITAAGAVLAVTSRRVLHAALWLVVALAGLAGCYLVLGAELVALVQLLVYVGAVVVLVLFAVPLWVLEHRAAWHDVESSATDTARGVADPITGPHALVPA